jgi:hypothetical protein
MDTRGLDKKPNTLFKNAFKEIAQTGVNAGVRYGCLLLTVIILIIVLCFTVLFAFRYLTMETKRGISGSFPWNSQDKQESNDKKFKRPEEPNKSVIVGKLEWRILESKTVTGSLPGDDGETDYCKPGQGNKFIYVKYSVRNIDRAFVTVPKNFNDIFDRNENKYEPSSKSVKCLTGDTGLKERYLPDVLQRDEKVELEVLYEVPNDSKDFRMKVGDLSTVGKEFDYIALGI